MSISEESSYSSTSSCSTIVLRHDFDSYVSEVVGATVQTGYDVIELTEEFRRQLAIDLKAQEQRFAEEDRRLAEYIEQLQKQREAASSPTVDAEDKEEDAFDEMLLELDPTEYRKHDLYKVLGLDKRRHLATAEEIKLAYRRRCVDHHPDKLKQKPRSRPLNNPNLEDDSFFKLIQKAFQVLTDPTRRADFDACDPAFDETVPEADELPDYTAHPDTAAFYAAFAPVFARNGKFSRKQPVPDLGNHESSRDHVEAFYSFWVTFESKRRFEWLDEDEPAGTENRADKRWHEKKNKTKRDARKKEDSSRIIKLTDLAMRKDPRMLRWKEADREARNAKKNGKEAVARAAREAEAARKAAEAAEKAAAEAVAKAAQENAAAIKSAAKTVIKAARKAFREAVGNPEDWAVSMVAELKDIQAAALAVERVVSATAENPAKLSQISKELEALLAAEFGGSRKGHLKRLLQFLEDPEIGQAQGKTLEAAAPAATAVAPATVAPATIAARAWSTQEVDLLIASVNQFPGGTAKRWEQITAALNRQIANVTGAAVVDLSVEEVIKKANDLQKEREEADVMTSQAVADDLNANRDAVQTAAALAAARRKRDPRVDQAAPTVAAHYYANDNERILTETEKENTTATAPAISPVTWTPQDQLALEAALKSVPTEAVDRWDQVAAAVTGKSKKECVARVREIAALLKAKSGGNN